MQINCGFLRKPMDLQPSFVGIIIVPEQLTGSILRGSATSMKPLINGNTAAHPLHVFIFQLALQHE